MKCRLVRSYRNTYCVLTADIFVTMKAIRLQCTVLHLAKCDMALEYVSIFVFLRSMFRYVIQVHDSGT